MNQFRETSCEYISCVSIVFAKVDDNSITLYKFIFLLNKLQLLLHPERELEKEALELFSKIMTTVMLNSNKPLHESMLQVREDHNNLIVLCRAILEKNWQKINNIDKI